MGNTHTARNIVMSPPTLSPVSRQGLLEPLSIPRKGAGRYRIRKVDKVEKIGPHIDLDSPIPPFERGTPCRRCKRKFNTYINYNHHFCWTLKN